MNIAVIGTGYVGLTTGTCFAEMGNQVLCHDIDDKKISLLKNGGSPIYEPTLDDLIVVNLAAGRLNFTTNIADAVDSAEVVFCAVPTPPDENSRADLSLVYEVAHEFGRHINKKKLFIMKSTVPVSTNEKCREIIQDEIKARGLQIEFDVVSNPEFLRQGSAVNDTMRPDRIIVGAESDYAKNQMRNLYKPLIDKGITLVMTSIKAAEMIKYAANAFLCTKISFINEISNFCDEAGCDVNEVARGIGLDKRIGESFLNAGIGYGGNCLKKDINALIAMGVDVESDMSILREVERVNDHQRLILVEKFQKTRGSVEGKKIAIFGLTFKPETDDYRDAPSIDIIRELLEKGAFVNLYDPLGTENFIAKYFSNNEKIRGNDSVYDSVIDVDAIMLVTEWKEFQDLDFAKIARLMKGDLVLDGRNALQASVIEDAGLQYIGVGNS
ncbi:UDP-glucose/GDP-mannose dehydrogenase family protein [Patescibacteria group bacterium]|nr:UDP-glucose/GDP-mannose dehydrogenase family protein [Patescibacteria group bacterium]